MTDNNETIGKGMVNDFEANESVTIPEDVLGVISCIAALEAEGIYALSGNITKDKAAKLSPRTAGGCVKVGIEGNDVTISLSAEIEYGFTATSVAKEIQSKVKQAVENMTEYKVAKVNVYFAGIHIDSERP